LIKELGRQALHAKALGFIHPATGEYLEFDTELPEDMARIIDYLEKQQLAAANQLPEEEIHQWK
jgi:23S rRNA pseudouridine1911/1915/1917 synthase